MAKLNITQSAEHAGIGRNTLYDHMRKGKVSYEVDEHGKKWIDASELERAYGRSNSGGTIKERPSERSIEHDRTPEIEQLLRQQIKGLERQVEDLHEERNKLLGIVEKQTLLIEHRPERAEENPHSAPESADMPTKLPKFVKMGATWAAAVLSAAFVVLVVLRGALYYFFGS